MENDAEEQARLPDDFNIDSPISILTKIVLTRIPLSIQFYHLIKRLEEQKAVKDGRMYICIHYVLCSHLTVSCLVWLNVTKLLIIKNM